MKLWFWRSMIALGWSGVIGAAFFIVYLFALLFQRILSDSPGEQNMPYVVALFVFSIGLAGAAGFLAWAYGTRKQILKGRKGEA
jgi:nitrate reductase NapE component